MFLTLTARLGGDTMIGAMAMGASSSGFERVMDGVVAVFGHINGCFLSRHAYWRVGLLAVHL